MPGPQGSQPIEGQKDRQRAFEGVPQKGEDPGVAPQQAEQVGGPEVAAAGVAGVGSPHQPGHHQPGGQGSQEIGEPYQPQKYNMPGDPLREEQAD
jgi:hypothetical protein